MRRGTRNFRDRVRRRDLGGKEAGSRPDHPVSCLGHARPGARIGQVVSCGRRILFLQVRVVHPGEGTPDVPGGRILRSRNRAAIPYGAACVVHREPRDGRPDPPSPVRGLDDPFVLPVLPEVPGRGRIDPVHAHSPVIVVAHRIFALRPHVHAVPVPLFPFSLHRPFGFSGERAPTKDRRMDPCRPVRPRLRGKHRPAPPARCLRPDGKRRKDE